MRIKDAYLERALAGEASLVFDGAMGTMLQREGLLKGGMRSDLISLMNPAGLTGIHKMYVDAGAQVIISNTFSANRLNLAKAGDSATVPELFEAAISCARASGADYVAADMGPLGELIEPYGDLEEDEAYDIFCEQAKAAKANGADLIIVETMISLDEALLAVRAAADCCDLPIFASMSYSGAGMTMFGESPADCAGALVAAGASVVGANCSTGPAELFGVAQAYLEAVAQLAQEGRAGSFGVVPILMQPNAGLPKTIDGQSVYDMASEEFGSIMQGYVDAGVRMLGSCCGSSPEFTAQLARLLR